MQSEELFAMVFIIGMFAGVFIIFLGLRQRSLQLEMQHRERMAMIERGQIPLARSQRAPCTSVAVPSGPDVPVAVGRHHRGGARPGDDDDHQHRRGEPGSRASASAARSRFSAAPSSFAACWCVRSCPQSSGPKPPVTTLPGRSPHEVRRLGSAHSPFLAGRLPSRPRQPRVGVTGRRRLRPITFLQTLEWALPERRDSTPATASFTID